MDSQTEEKHPAQIEVEMYVNKALALLQTESNINMLKLNEYFGFFSELIFQSSHFSLSLIIR